MPAHGSGSDRPPAATDGSSPPVDAPLSVEEIGRFRDPAGPGRARLDLAGVAIEMEGLPESLLAAMRLRYGPWLHDPDGAGRPLRLAVVEAPFDYFVPPAFASRWETYRVLTAYDGATFRFLSYRLAAWFHMDRREGRVVLAHGELDPAPRAMENLLRSAVAWLAIESDGLFLHGASIVRQGACRLFYGPSGAGKSTLAALGRQGRVISDDLTLLLRRPDGLMAAGGPFRGTYGEGAPVVGTFPVAGLYRLRKDEKTYVRRGDAGCFADLIANLPWIVDQLPRHPHLFDRARGVVAGVPTYYLHFQKDRDFWPAIDRGPEA